MTTDLIGRELEPREQQLWQVYRQLKELAGDDDLAPCVAANVRQSLACCAQAVTDLGLEFEHLTDLDV